MNQQVDVRNEGHDTELEPGARRGGVWQADGPVALVAAAAGAATWVVLTQLASVDLAVRAGSGTQHVNVISVVVASIVVTLVGGGLLRLLQRRTSRGLAIWTAVAGAVWVVSLSGPAGARTLSAFLGLALLHLVVGAVVVVGLRRRARAAAPRVA